MVTQPIKYHSRKSDTVNLASKKYTVCHFRFLLRQRCPCILIVVHCFHLTFKGRLYEVSDKNKVLKTS